MPTTKEIIEPFQGVGNYKGEHQPANWTEPPELYDRPVPTKDIPELRKAIRLYVRTLAKNREYSASAYDDMKARGAPTEDFAEDGYFDDDVHALETVRKAYPEMVAKYFVGFSPKYGKEAPHGMGRYDRYGGL